MLNLQDFKSSWRNIPSMVRVVLFSTLLVMVWDGSIFGFQTTSLGWLLPLFFALRQIVLVKGKIRFPVMLWLPWVLLILIYLAFADAKDALQRTVMLLCPLATGIAVSKLEIGRIQLASFLNMCRYCTVLVLLFVLLKSGLLLTGQLPQVTGMAAEVMTAALFCSVFAATYVVGYRNSLLWWAGLACVPFVAMTRTVMVVAALTLPATLAPLGLVRRVLLLVLMAGIGLAAFHTERVQNKMFFSGHGTLSDISLDNPDFRTTGRITILHALEYEVQKEPWLGHGANASEELVREIAGGLTHPHNDWLRFEYDYGYVGAGVFALCMLLQLLHAWWISMKSSGVARILFLAGASSFVSMAMIMFTDNIVLYAAFFGNLQFAILGLAYAGNDRKNEKFRRRPA